MKNSHNGEKYGKLLIIGSENINKKIMQKCICDCGNEKYVHYSKLKSGHTKSCGCLKNKYMIKNKRIFNCWWNMKERCDSSGRNDSKYYHDKGITYCEEWNKYENFQEWALNNGYADNLTLDRIDGKLSYCPSNCRWITIEEQQRNRSFCLYFSHNGETKTLAEWARKFGINRTTLYDRIYKFGYSFEEAVTRPIKVPKNSILMEYNGEIFTQSQFSKRFNTSRQRVKRLMSKGYTVEQIVNELTSKKYELKESEV